MKYYADRHRHLICLPYSKKHLHEMAAALGIKRAWFHGKPVPHYDIPKKRELEILNHPNVRVIRRRELYEIAKTNI